MLYIEHQYLLHPSYTLLSKWIMCRTPGWCCRRQLLGRWTAQQEAEDHDYCQAAGDSQDGVQQQPQAREACEGTVESGHGAGHARRPGLVPEQVSSIACNQLVDTFIKN